MKIALLVFILSTAGFAQKPSIDPKLESSVKTGNQEWIDGLKSGDIDQITRAYADDAVNCGATGECVRGRAEIQKQMAASIAPFGKAVSANVFSDGLIPNGDLAYEWGRATVQFKQRSSSGRFVTIWKKQPDGSWKIIRNMGLPATSTPK